MPTKRTHVQVDYASGTALGESKIVDDGETIEERFASLKAEVEERAPGPGIHMLSVRCDGCGIVEDVDEPKLPSGWISNERGEFCPSCK
jgi:hypothetical protein